MARKARKRQRVLLDEEWSPQILGLAAAAKQCFEEEQNQKRAATRAAAEEEMDTPTKNDSVLDWMYKNLSSDQWNAETYVSLNSFGERTLAQLDAEELSLLPPELYPRPVTRRIQ